MRQQSEVNISICITPNKAQKALEKSFDLLWAQLNCLEISIAQNNYYNVEIQFLDTGHALSSIHETFFLMCQIYLYDVP